MVNKGQGASHFMRKKVIENHGIEHETVRLQCRVIPFDYNTKRYDHNVAKTYQTTKHILLQIQKFGVDKF